MSRVITERDRLAVLAANSALSAQDQIRRTSQLSRIPTHPGRLRQPEHRPARFVEQHALRDRQPPDRTVPVRDDLIEARIT